MPFSTPGPPTSQTSQSALASIMAGPPVKDWYSTSTFSSSKKPILSATYQGMEWAEPAKKPMLRVVRSASGVRPRVVPSASVPEAAVLPAVLAAVEEEEPPQAARDAAAALMPATIRNSRREIFFMIILLFMYHSKAAAGRFG